MSATYKKYCLWAVGMLIHLSMFSQGVDISQRFDDILTAHEKNNLFSGNILIVKNDSFLYSKSVGYSDAGFQKNHSQTIFKIGSLTKQFTAALILKLVSKGDLSLNDTLSKFLDGVNFSHPITIRNLLNNTSGIPNYYFFEGYHQFKKTQQSTDSMLDRILSTRLNFIPGTKFEYSNSGFYLLGLIAENVTGMPYGKALKNYILDPLGLSSTRFADKDELLANGFKIIGQELMPADFIDLYVPYSAGGLISNMGDLNNWSMSLFDGFISSELFAEMIKPNLGNYGFGFWIDQTKYGRKIWHTGGIDGFRSIMSFYPQKDLRIIVLSNREGYAIKKLESDMLQILIEQ